MLPRPPRPLPLVLLCRPPRPLPLVLLVLPALLVLRLAGVAVAHEELPPHLRPLSDWGPPEWTTAVEPPAPAEAYGGHAPDPQPRALLTGGALRFSALAFLRFYQDWLSPLDGPVCPMYPVCSRFSIIAVREHGAFFGTLMSIDRLFYRENPSMGGFYPFTELEPDTFRYLDPVEQNWIFGDPRP